MEKSRTSMTAPRLGIFWFVPIDQDQKFFGRSAPIDRVDCIGGFKTLSVGHVEVWPELQRAYGKLRGYEYEFFPRGRVNWREADNMVLLLADEVILRNHLHKVVLSRWNLRDQRYEVLRDPHYRVNKLA